ncbi:PRC-barrel domain-containing protein [Jatrophihabitans sp.]|uniref:PRC-barrel domain-containing protein n=1 Tax=Jatrophihabitans sp. TaxID=1932789 RepID=UPI002B5F9E08|nr:PRC-barrel domain-containing protein [Jatrophihabitans sp.]
MKASDLIHQPVFDDTGRRIGVVTDLRCVQDGPLRGAMAAPRVHQVIVSRRRTGSLLGYDRREQQGPWLIRRIVRWLHRDLMVVPWESVRISGDDGPRTVVVTGPAATDRT